MKLTLPIYGRFCCGNDVAVVIQIMGESDMLVIKCTEYDEVWGKHGVYSTFGLIEFDTNDLKMESSNVFSQKSPCLYYKDIKFMSKTDEELRDWFYQHYKCFVKG